MSNENMNILQKIKDRIYLRLAHDVNENKDAWTHNPLLPFYIQLQALERLESIDDVLKAMLDMTTRPEPIGDVKISQDGKIYKGILLSVEDDD